MAPIVTAQTEPIAEPPTAPETTPAANCSSYNKALTHLHDRFDENVVGRGLAYGDTLLEILVSTSGTWTILNTDANKKACIIATGTDWEQVWTIQSQVKKAAHSMAGGG